MKEHKDGLIGWWTAAPAASTNEEKHIEARATCRYASTARCPYYRPEFGCEDCVIEVDGVYPRA